MLSMRVIGMTLQELCRAIILHRGNDGSSARARARALKHSKQKRKARAPGCRSYRNDAGALCRAIIFQGGDDGSRARAAKHRQKGSVQSSSVDVRYGALGCRAPFGARQ